MRKLDLNFKNEEEEVELDENGNPIVDEDGNPNGPDID